MNDTSRNGHPLNVRDIERHNRKHYTREQRRKLKKLAGQIDRIVEADRLFFERFPGRQYRVRYMGKAETQSLDITMHKETSTPDHLRWFVLVEKLAPDLRSRRFFRGPRDLDPEDCDEDAAAALSLLINQTLKGLES